MTSLRAADVPTRRLYRRPERARLAGVAAGIADHTGIPLRRVRQGFVLLALMGGFGVALYAAYWIVVPPAPDSPPGRLPVGLEYLAGAVALVVAVSSVTQSFPGTGGPFVPALLAVIGGALIWRQASEPERDRLRSMSRTSLAARTGEGVGRARLLVGAALVAAGAVYVLVRADVTAVRDGLVAMAVTVVGLALVTGPWWMRTVTQLSDERARRIRSQERADIAAQLHDSVLQTLALIQRNASSPREVARLARGQERQLRTMLYGHEAPVGDVGEALRAVAAEVEDGYAVSVEVVVVGSAPTDEHLGAAVAAVREALMNAARHSGVASVSLYAEIEPDAVSVFVKDRGAGFDPETIGPDRQGLRGSIVGRVERHGGEVDVSTAAGAGTEIVIRMPRRPREGSS